MNVMEQLIAHNAEIDAMRLARAQKHMRAYGVELSQLAARIPQVGERDSLVLAGSVAEGLSNELSDIDIILLRGSTDSNARNDFEGPLRTGDSNIYSGLRQPEGFDIQIEVWEADQLQRLCEAQLRSAQYCVGERTEKEVGGMPTFSQMERRALHRLRTGFPLHNAPAVEAMRSAYRFNLLPLVTFFTEAGYHFATREDAIGQVKGKGEPDTVCLMVHICTVHLAKAALAAIGETHPYPKWTATLLHRHAAVLGEDHVEAMLDLLIPARGQAPEPLVRRLIKVCDDVLGRVFERFPGTGPAINAYRDRIGMTYDFA